MVVVDAKSQTATFLARTISIEVCSLFAFRFLGFPADKAGEIKYVGKNTRNHTQILPVFSRNML